MKEKMCSFSTFITIIKVLGSLGEIFATYSNVLKFTEFLFYF
jgi:hypothetical protein